jgi:hypothetical protein
MSTYAVLSTLARHVANLWLVIPSNATLQSSVGMSQINRRHLADVVYLEPRRVPPKLRAFQPSTELKYFTLAECPTH